MATDREPLAIDPAAFAERVDHGRERIPQVVRILVVLLTARTHDRQIRFDDRIAQQRQDLHRAGADIREAVLVEIVQIFVVIILVRVFGRIEPEHRGQLGARLIVIGQCHIHS